MIPAIGLTSAFGRKQGFRKGCAMMGSMDAPSTRFLAAADPFGACCGWAVRQRRHSRQPAARSRLRPPQSGSRLPQSKAFGDGAPPTF